MDEKTKNNPNIFGCKTVELIPCIVFWTITLIYFLPWSIEFSEHFLLFVVSVVFDVLSILAYIANKRSYIELTDTHLVLRKPSLYPLFHMETISIPYEEIESVYRNLTRWFWLWYCIAITKRVWYDKDWIIKFFWLKDGLMFLSKMNEKILEHKPQDITQEDEYDEDGEDWNEEEYLKEVYGEQLYHYKVYKRTPNRFVRIVFIILAIISLITIAGVPLSLVLILLIIWDIKKCNSYIEFTTSHVIIYDCKWGAFAKNQYLEIPYYEICEIKIFEYFGQNIDDTNCNFNIYFKNNEKMESFTVEKSGSIVDTYLIEKILADKNIKTEIHG